MSDVEPVLEEQIAAEEAVVEEEAVEEEAVEAPDPTDGVPETERLSLPAKLEALLFLSNEPLTVGQLVEACESSESKIEQALSALEEDFAEGKRGLVLRRIGGGFALASAPGADTAAKRLFSKPRTPPLTQAQAECLAIIAYLQPVSRPEIARIRGVSSESALTTLLERGLVADAGRSKFGAVIFRTTELFDQLFGLNGLDSLPDVTAFDPSAADEADLRERLLKAGDARSGAQPAEATAELTPATETSAETAETAETAAEAHEAQAEAHEAQAEAAETPVEAHEAQAETAETPAEAHEAQAEAAETPVEAHS